jgi:hypothetical protein
MALRKIIELEGRCVVQTPIGVFDKGTEAVSFSAYIKVISVAGNKTQVTANVNFKSDDKEINKSYQIPVTTNQGSENFIAQAYRYLKTLPEFAGAVDC